MDKPYSPACDRNRDAILKVLHEYFSDCHSVLEIGSGSGQHAVHFAAAMPNLQWQTSDIAENIAGIRIWLDEAALPNTPLPLTLDVNGKWPARTFDAVFSANTLHIMSWQEVERLFSGLSKVTEPEAVVAIYGPFNYKGRFTSASNAAFDAALKQRGAQMGIRDFEAVNALAQAIGLQLVADVPMPANNRTLVWKKTSPR